MTQPDELKPCPFCPTGKGTITKWVAGSALDEFAPYRPTCDKCGCELDDFDTEQQARDAWNTRSTPDELKNCPFCGGSVAVNYTQLHGYDKYVIRCCEVNILRATPEDAITKWNTRSTPDLSREQLIADVKRLRTMLSIPLRAYSDPQRAQTVWEYLAVDITETLAATDRPEYK